MSHALRRRFLSAGIGRASQYRVVHTVLDQGPYENARSLRSAARTALGLRPDDVVAGTLARLDKLKGHADLLLSLPVALRRVPRLKLLWVGDGPECTRLEHLAAALGPGRVVFAGPQPSERIPFYLAAMDMLAHPSYREGYPLAVLQAMLSGLPTVAYDIAGSAELSVHGTTGFLVPTGNVAAFGDALCALALDPSLRSEMGAAAKAVASSRSRQPSMTSALDAIYREVLG